MRETHLAHEMSAAPADLARVAPPALPPAAPPTLPRWKFAFESLIARGGVVLLTLALGLFLALPLGTILVRSVQDRPGEFVGLTNFSSYLASPGFVSSLTNTAAFAILTTLLTVPLAFLFAYAMQRACTPWRGLWRSIALIPILAPSLLPALSFLYLFGNQGWLNFMLAWFGLDSIYGLPGMVLAMSFASLPHAVMIMMAALALSDARLYEAADALGTSGPRKFFTITLPGAKYGLISASLVVFTMAVSEFGVPKVIGGNVNVLALDIYKQVVGQQNFAIGAVVAVLLLVPALVAFVIDRSIEGKQKALLSARSVAYAPQPQRLRDALLLGYVLLLSLAMVMVMGMAVFGSFVQFWPYDLSFTLRHYIYGLTEAGIDNAYFNSLTMAAWTALIGTAVTFAGAYWLEKTQGANFFRPLAQFQALLPMAVPGMVLGIGYILFFNAPANPLGFLYGTLAILVLSTVVHFYSSSHLTAVTALKSLDGEFESVSASLKVPFYKTFCRVTVPVCMPAVLDIARYFFVNAMTTISAVVFLYGAQTTLASVSILQLDEAGALAPAAAMASLIVFTSAAVTALFFALEWWLVKRTQRWRSR
jgi:iron(III) transport system permease protein